jgi:peptidyl-dipeptidase Dcp
MRTITILLAVAVAIPVVAAPTAPQPVNPLLVEWQTPFGTPPFSHIKPAHFMPAFEATIAQHNKEIDAIAKSSDKATFDNTIAALDDSGEALGRVNAVFGLLSGAETNDELQAIDAKIQPILAAHNDDIYLNAKLFARVKTIFDARAKAQLDPEQTTLLERTYRQFVRGGANLGTEQKKRLRAINGELSSLIVKFSDNLLKETNAFKLVVDNQADLAGLPADQITAAAETAAGAGLAGKWVFTLKGPSIWPFLQNASNRELRRKLLDAYTTRCDHGGDTDNKKIFSTIAALRVEKAQLLGYRTWANYILDEYMAKKPENVYALLEQLWKPALAKARQEVAENQAMIDAAGGGFKLEAHDWRLYSEKVKKAKYDLDEETIKPYFPLEQVIKGAFTLANKLYGITFKELTNVPVYHPEVKVYEAKEKDGKHLGIFYLDVHPRPGKRGGAWCSTLRDQWVKNGAFVTPVVYNVGNFARPIGGAPALLTPDDTETLFHEFGHALHSLFSANRFRGSGLVAQDFVELPSQIMENWVFEPEMLALYARHYKTGEVIPEALVAKIRKAASFNQGFAWTERLAASLLDMDWHTLTEPKVLDTTAFEKASLGKWGLIPEIPSRYRTTYFLHSSDEYSAGYYSYTWSDVLDSDAFMDFKETGNLFEPQKAAAFRVLLSKGGSEDPALLYRRFRGRDPKVDALLDMSGLR